MLAELIMEKAYTYKACKNASQSYAYNTFKNCEIKFEFLLLHASQRATNFKQRTIFPVVDVGCMNSVMNVHFIALIMHCTVLTKLKL